jgi:hypothetical protein
MNWKIKVIVGEVSIEAEIPLTDRTAISMKPDGSGTTTKFLLESLFDKALEGSIRFENEKPKGVTTSKKDQNESN